MATGAVYGMPNVGALVDTTSGRRAPLRASGKDCSLLHGGNNSI
jgi:hypothetical protein